MDCDPLSTANLLWLASALRRSITNPVTRHSLTIWDRLKKRFGLQSPHNPLLSFLRNPSFYPTWSFPTSFSAWTRAGLIRAYQFFTSTTLKTFQTLCKSHDIPSSVLFHFLQIKHFLTPFTPSDPSESGFISFESICKTDPHRRGLISELYTFLIAPETVKPPEYVSRWKIDLNRTFDQADWSSIWQATKSSSPNIAALETNYKVLTR